MSGPLAGVRVIEVAMWAFVPSAGAILSDMGADVIKLEPPAGDPIRALVTGADVPGSSDGFVLSWENYNRGKRSVTLDLNVDGALDVLDRMLESADVFLTSLLPPARRRLGIDVEQIRTRHPKLIYAVGSGSGAHGPQAEKGGYDAITFWARGGIADAVTPPEQPYPLPMPSGAFGDCTSGAALAGGICAALYKRQATGAASVVDVSLLGTSLWSMQRTITEATIKRQKRLPRHGRTAMPNPLVNTYRTADDRFLALCMLQGQRYWPGFCEAVGRADLATDARYATAEARAANLTECVAEIDAIFATRSLADWRVALATQGGQWDVVQQPGELVDDEQVVANALMQDVDYGDGRSLKMVSAPMQFDRKALPARAAPEKGAGNDEVLAELGYDEDAIIDLKVAGIVY
ncbi:CaiB/BaiF CoA transferase family protein [Sphingomonas immobilis]|uniref:CoA transferase n=1 Tax=Sphingomonas immobilis TaxID=3063997 RepID=A0ABT8ZX53_9SPHN|nr:CoA transferase [Sphingomonas sp. CA1-15]MDO7842146.1 CoA transferase [Sphingomonas sp. CA1-15]